MFEPDSFPSPRPFDFAPLRRVPDALHRGKAYIARAGGVVVRISRPTESRFGRGHWHPDLCIVPLRGVYNDEVVYPPRIVVGMIRAVVGERLQAEVLEGRADTRTVTTAAPIEWIAEEGDAERAHFSELANNWRTLRLE